MTTLPPDLEILSPDECSALLKKIESMGQGGGNTFLALRHRQSGTAKWARSQLHLGYDTSTVELSIRRSVHGAAGQVTTSRLDDQGLLRAVRTAERLLEVMTESPEYATRAPFDEPMLQPEIWNDSTLALSAQQRGDIVRQLLEPARAEGLLAAGSLEIAAEGHATLSSSGLFRYYPFTDVLCSVSVRDTGGTASGWAGSHSHDVAKIDPGSLGRRALDKCIRMVNPVGVEPGRYPTILEPQAVCDLLSPLMTSRGFDRYWAEGGVGPFHQKPGWSKIGELVLDRRLTLRADPMDADGGFVPFNRYNGQAYQPVSWIDDGILRDLAYNELYALAAMGKQHALMNPRSYRLSANTPPVSLGQMIAATERGIYVTRFHDVRVVDENSMLCSGYTRDGVWLIEGGKLSKAIKNFRFSESPIFVLNSVESIGEPVRVFNPPYACVVPPIKVKEFSFVGLADAV